MALPKVIFEKMNIEENLETLVWYAIPENSKDSPLDFYKFTLRLFPELKGLINEKQTYEEVYEILDKTIKNIIEDVANKSKDIETFQKIWDEVNDGVMKDLQYALNTLWPDDYQITCRLCMLPVSPRDINAHAFAINYGTKKKTLIQTCIHELCHFIYFKKWKEMYPEYSEEEFDNPHIAWYLSEAMIDPLLNNAGLNKYTGERFMSYSVFYEILIDDKNIIDWLDEYVKNYPMEEAIKKGYELFKKYEYIIKNH